MKWENVQKYPSVILDIPLTSKTFFGFKKTLIKTHEEKREKRRERREREKRRERERRGKREESGSHVPCGRHIDN